MFLSPLNLSLVHVGLGEVRRGRFVMWRAVLGGGHFVACIIGTHVTLIDGVHRRRYGSLSDVPGVHAAMFHPLCPHFHHTRLAEVAVRCPTAGGNQGVHVGDPVGGMDGTAGDIVWAQRAAERQANLDLIHAGSDWATYRVLMDALPVGEGPMRVRSPDPSGPLDHKTAVGAAVVLVPPLVPPGAMATPGAAQPACNVHHRCTGDAGRERPYVESGPFRAVGDGDIMLAAFGLRLDPIDVSPYLEEGRYILWDRGHFSACVVPAQGMALGGLHVGARTNLPRLAWVLVPNISVNLLRHVGADPLGAMDDVDTLPMSQSHSTLAGEGEEEGEEGGGSSSTTDWQMWAGPLLKRLRTEGDGLGDIVCEEEHGPGDTITQICAVARDIKMRHQNFDAYPIDVQTRNALD